MKRGRICLWEVNKRWNNDRGCVELFDISIISYIMKLY
jgi:hypothetical protein